MRVFRYWARGSAQTQGPTGDWNVECFGSSNTSIDEAMVRAREAAMRSAEAITSGAAPGGYGYTDRALREEIIEAIPGLTAEQAVVTRNGYGAMVLNTATVMFVDMDLPPAQPDPVGFMKRLFGGSSQAADPSEQIVSRVRDVAESAGVGVRLYRTAAGFRGLITNRTFDPQSDEAQELLGRFDADPMYIRLCRAQSCFRARLTAKYWRCGLPRPPVQFPFRDSAAESTYRAWELRYHETADTFATCALVGTFGPADTTPITDTVIRYHDEMTCVDGIPLA